MQEEPATTTATTEAKHEGAGFPPFKTETFPSQIFWLVVTFAFLFTVLWRVAGPRIKSVLAERRGKINDDLKTAELHRKDAEAAVVAYQAPMIEARERAREIAEQTRAAINREADTAKTNADREASEAQAKAQARIAEVQAQARRNITEVAQGAVVDIVERLTGEKLSQEEAAAAVRQSVGA
ncbi:MAG TPA: hypothetical protein VHL34_15015 [Rhizomicrobium sp.]|jgi:F-type H+-transporting ATPase subunit b|nr:hypothetical protein [Rhizomicrobium sp.]